MLKREQSLDSICWDQLHRGVSIDDFRKLSALQQTASPLGSREHLATTGIIWNGGLSGTIDRSIVSRPALAIRMSSKPVGPKQKMLRKQQSMLAFFPEHSNPPPIRSALPIRVTQSNFAYTGNTSLTNVTSGGSIGAGSGGGGEGEGETFSTSDKPSLNKGLPSRSQSLDEDQTLSDEQENAAITLDHRVQPIKVDKITNSAVCLLS